jgi:hypothetical protein
MTVDFSQLRVNSGLLIYGSNLGMPHESRKNQVRWTAIEV